MSVFITPLDNAPSGCRVPARRGGFEGRAPAILVVTGCVALACGLTVAPNLAGPVFVVGAGAVVAFLLHPMLVFTVYYGLSLPTTALYVQPIPLSLNQIGFLIFFLSFARWAWTRRLVMPRGGPLWATLSLAAYYAGSALTGKSWEFGLVATKTIATLLAVGLAVAAMTTTPNRARQLCWAIVAPTVLSALVAVCEAIVRHDLFGNRIDYYGSLFRVNGFSPNSIVFAYTCFFAFPFALWLARHGKAPGARAVALGSAFFLFLISLMTFNRQTMLLAPILVLLAAWEFRGRLGRTLVIGALIGAAVLSPRVAPAVGARLRQLKTREVDWSFRTRYDNLLNAIQIFRHDPWFGCGMGSFPRAWWEVRSLDNFFMLYDWDWDRVEPDMNYVRLLAETGLVGLGLTLAFCAGMVSRLWRRRRRLRASGEAMKAQFASAVLLTWALFLIASAIQDTSLYLRTWLTFGLTIPFVRGGAVENWPED